MPERTPGKLWPAYAGLVLTPLFWAGNAVVARSVVDTIPPVSLAFWRWCVAFAILLPFALPGIRRQWPVIVQHRGSMLALAAFSVGAFNTLLYLSAVTTTALNITLVNSTIPIMVALLSWLILGDRTRPLQAAGIALALVGMLVIVGQGSLETFARLAFQPGDLIMVAAVFSWGLFSVLLRRQSVPLEPLTFLAVQVGLGILVILPFYLVDLLLFSGGFQLTSKVIPPLLYVAVFPGILAYAFWNNGVHRVGPPKAAVFMYLTPVYGALLAGVFLGERLSLFHLTGGLLILIGLVLTTRPAGLRSRK
ncbi:DMT family transporter [Marinobacter sp.]|uniref:DMT family transporter n=1 Tax=Marinobacter sp. TaxID=50741 RepID=UPI003850C287